MEMTTITHHAHPMLPTVGRSVRLHRNLQGASVREVLLVEGFDPAETIVIYFNDRLLTVEEWDVICPAPGDVVNVLVQVNGGGGGGGSNPIAAVASIALMVVAPMAATALLGDVVATTFAAYAGGVGVTWGQILGASISIVGNAVIGSIFKPSQPSLTASPTASIAQASPTYSLSGGSNRMRPYEVMPVVMGTHRFFPDAASRPYTEFQGDDQFLYQIFHLGLSPASYTDWKIGTTPLSDYWDVTWHWPDEQGRINDFPGNVDTVSGATLTKADGAIIRQTSADTYQIGIDVEGTLYHANDAGGLDSVSVYIDVEYRAVGATEWLPGGDIVKTWTANGYWAFGYMVSKTFYEEGLPVTTSSWVQYFYDGSTDINAPHDLTPHWERGYYGWWTYTPYPNYAKGIDTATLVAGNPGLSVILGIGLQVSAINSVLEIINRSDGTAQWPCPARPYTTAPQKRMVLTSGSQKPLRKSQLIKVTPGTYEVRLTRTTGDSSDARTQSATSWSVLRSYQMDTATYAEQLRVGLSIKASAQLNGAVQQLSCTATALCTYWDGSAWVKGATANPAHWYMQFAKGMIGPSGRLLWGCGLGDAQIDLAALHDWASFCAAENLSFGYVLDSSKTAADVLNLIARCGFASPSWATGRLGVTWDGRNQTPVAMFGMGNILKDSFSVEYVSDKLADEIIVSYINAANDWQTDQVRQLVPGVVNPERTTTVDIEGCTSNAMAGKFANYLAAQQHYRRRHVTWDCDFEGFVCQRGDVVLLSHDLTQWGYSGRIVAASGNTVTLDRAVPRSGDTEYFMLKRPDGSMTTYTVVAGTGESDALTLTSAPAFEDGREVFDHTYSFSPLATPGKKVKIISVRPVSESRVQIVATDEDPEFYAAWDGTFTATKPSTLLTGTTPAVTAIRVSEHLYLGAAKAVLSHVVVTWDSTGNADRFALRYRIAGGAWVRADAISPSFAFDTTATGTLEFEVTPISGITPGPAARTEYWLQGLQLPPDNVQGLTSVYRDGRTVLIWRAVTDIRAITYEVRKGATWETAQSFGRTPLLEFTADAGDGMYWVAAAASAGAGYALSATPAAIEIAGATLVANVVAAFDEEATGWQGTCTGSAMVSGSDIILGPQGLFSGIPLVSAVGSVFWYGGVGGSGVYQIQVAHEVDVGTAQPCNVSATYRLRADAPLSLFSAVPLVSALPSVAGNYAGLADATIQISIAQNDAVYADWRDFIPGQYVGRKFRFRAVLTSSDPAVTAILDTFSFAVDMPDRMDKGTAIACPAGGLTVTYSRPFQIAPNVQVTILSAIANDDVVLTNQSTAGFTVQVLQGGAGVARTLNWISQGY